MSQRLEEAKEQTKPLIGAGYLSQAEILPRNRARLLRAHWVSALWLKQYDEVLEGTKDGTSTQTCVQPMWRLECQHFNAISMTEPWVRGNRIT
jgi:hypothetical protein